MEKNHPSYGIWKDQREYLIKTIGELKGKIKNSTKEEKYYLTKEMRGYEKTLSMLDVEPVQKNAKHTGDSSKKLVDNLLENSQQKTFKEIADLLRDKKVSRVVIHANENEKNAEKFGKLTFKKELDSHSALSILNRLITYTESGAMTSIIPKGGTKKTLAKLDEQEKKEFEEIKKKNPDHQYEETETDEGMTLIVDVGGEWIKIEGSNGTRTIYIDHHGEKQHDPTSATEFAYEIYKASDESKNQPKENLKWLEKYVKEVTRFDNLSYLNDKDKKGKKIYNEKYIQNENGWARTPYALGDDLPKEIMQWYRTGKIKNFYRPLTDQQLKELGGEKLIKIVKAKAKRMHQTVENIKFSIDANTKEGLELKNTNVGNIVYHNFPARTDLKGKNYNEIDNPIAFIGSSALGFDTYICWNKKDGTFYINSKHPEIEEVVEKLNKIDPGCVIDVRGEMFFGKIINLTEKQFLDIVDPNITKNVKEGIISNEKSPIKNDEKEEEIENPNIIKKIQGKNLEITKEMIQNRAFQIYENRLKTGEQGDEKSDWYKAEKELREENLKTEDKTKTIENSDKKEPVGVESKETENKTIVDKEIKKEETEKDAVKLENEIKQKIEDAEKIIAEQIKEKENLLIEGDLNSAREKYASGYKAFLADKKEKNGFFKNLKNKIFGHKYKDEEVPEQLKVLEQEYNALIVKYGNKMYYDKKAELVKQGLTEEQQIAELNLFKKNEIYQKTIVEEGQKLNALKAENLPPKEKALWRKGMDWYIKQPRWKKIAVSTALSIGVFAAFMPSMVAAGGGILAYAGTRVGRAIIGTVVGQGAVKLYDVSVKDRTTERKEQALDELSKNFKEGMTDGEILKYKKEYEKIIEKEKAQKRNRLFHKASIAIIAGGGAAFEAGNIIQHFQAEHALAAASGVVDAPKIAPEHLFKAEEVQISSKGAIQTIENLKHKILTEYPDISKAPHSMQEFLKTNSTDEAIKLGFFDPSNPNGAESATLLEGSTLGFNEHGDLSYHDIKTGQTHSLITEQGNTEIADKYHGKMFDSDHSAKVSHESINNTNEDYRLPVQKDPTTGLPVNHDNVVPGTNEDYSVPKQTDPTINNNPNNAETVINQDANQIENVNTEHVLSAEELSKIGEYSNENLKHLFPTDKLMEKWDYLKNNVTAERLLEMSDKGELKGTDLEPLVDYVHKIEEVTGIHPVEESILNPEAESIPHFIDRALKVAVENDQLEKLKL